MDRRNDLDVVAFPLDCGFDDGEMNGRHFRRQDGVVLVALHRFREDRLRILDRLCASRLFAALLDGCLERTQTDAYSAKVQTLIDLETGIEPAALVHDLLHLIRHDRIQPAAEGIQLDELQMRMARHIVCRTVEAAVPRPLIHDAEIWIFTADHRDAVFRKHRHAELVDEIRDRVIYRRIHMVRTSGEHDANLMLLSDLRQHPLRLSEQSFLVLALRRFARIDRTLQLGRRDAHRRKDLFQLLQELLRRMQRQEGMQQLHLVLPEDLIHIRFDIFRIRCDHRAVVAVRTALIRSLVDAGIPDEIRMVLCEIRHMRVRELRREALGIRRDRLHRFGRDLADLLRGCEDTVAETSEEGMPEGEVLIHIEYARDADRAALRFLRRKRTAMPDDILLPAVHIRER